MSGRDEARLQANEMNFSRLEAGYRQTGKERNTDIRKD